MANAKDSADSAAALHTPELTPIAALKEHPRNYRSHPDDQLVHLGQSMLEHGVYRNVVAAQDGTILAGHGVVQAAKRVGFTELPVVRLPIDPNSPAAIRVLTGDNEIEHLAEQDDRLLSELLKQLAQDDPGELLGTGFDPAMLANFAMVTRPASEIQDFDKAAHWAGMPAYEPTAADSARVRLIVSFATEGDRADFYRRLGIDGPAGRNASMWWPRREKDDVGSLRLDEAAA